MKMKETKQNRQNKQTKKDNNSVRVCVYIDLTVIRLMDGDQARRITGL